MRGDSNKQIAREMGISIKTVESQIAKLTQRFRLRNRVELAVWAVHELESGTLLNS